MMSFCLGTRLTTNLPLANYLKETVLKFRALELPAEPRFLSPHFAFTDSEKKVLGIFRKRYAFRMTLHAPFIDIRLGARDAEERSLSYAKILNAIRLAAEMEIALVTFHPDAVAPEPAASYEEDCRREEEALSRLLPEAHRLGVILLIENMPRLPEYHPKTCDGSRIQELFWLFPETELGMTLDIGHALQAGVAPEALLRAGRVRHFHLHENDRCLDRHFAIRSNLEWWGKLLKKIAAKHPDTVGILEMNLLEEQLESRENLLRFLPNHPPRRKNS